MKYEAILFDWDGTAVYSRKAPVEDACARIREFLKKDIPIVIISGTTYENIAGGRLHEVLADAPLENLFLGLGRGSINIGFKGQKPVMLKESLPSTAEKIAIDTVTFEVHRYLYEQYGLPTDIVFSRPNYCKLDLMVAHDRGDQLFLQQSEIEQIQALLASYRIEGGLKGLIELADEIGAKKGLPIVTTTDAKYLEIGLTTKSDNVNFMVDHVLAKRGIPIEKCTFWGDEFTFLTEGVPGSDAFMITPKTEGADFFDVSENPYKLPEQVKHVGGGVPSFLQFLDGQINSL